MAEYTITAQLNVNRYHEDSGRVERGWWITWRDLQTGVVGQVWCADRDYPDKVAELVRAEVAKVRFAAGLTE